MKKLFLIILLFATVNFAQNTFNNLPVVKANSKSVDYIINGMLVKGQWNISPEISPDVMTFNLPPFPINFIFKTDIDSLVIKLTPATDLKFYVLLNGKDYALTQIKCSPFEKISHLNKEKNQNIKFVQNSATEEAYLDELRTKYNLNDLIKDCKTDLEKTVKILNWVHKQWDHNGNNTPIKSDAISILEEVKTGKKFRCVEYGIVSAACLNAIGLKARVIGLKMKDVETVPYGAGHVVAEVYLPEFKKWVFIDGQWDVIPVLNGIPLNAVEFRNAIASNYLNLKIKSLSGANQMFYINWIYPYLYYIDTKFDNRSIVTGDIFKIENRGSLMLVPEGAKNPSIFQIKNKIDYCFYTNNINDFYSEP